MTKAVPIIQCDLPGSLTLCLSSPFLRILLVSIFNSFFLNFLNPFSDYAYVILLLLLLLFGGTEILNF
jgi:hypothetical protein